MRSDATKMAQAISMVVSALDGMNPNQASYTLNVVANLYGLPITILPETPQESSPDAG
jgi:hypothetical protein